MRVSIAAGMRLAQHREAAVALALLLVGVILRLINVSEPLVDAWSWRQTDVAMIADNFYRHGFKLLYPEVNWGGNAPGYVVTEFPLVPFLASILYVGFGVQDWIGRSLSVFFFAFSAPFLYLLVTKTANSRTGVLAIGIWVLAPLSIFTGRSFMPDMASVSF